MRISYSGAFDWPAFLQFFERRAIPGVEQVTGRLYRRTIQVDGRCARLSVAHDPAERVLVVRVTGGSASGERVITRVRDMFDLTADLDAINAQLARDPSIAALVAARPALRVPGGWEPFEVAIRSIVGQQVSVERARQLNGILVERCGSAAPCGDGDLRRLFPTPEQVVDADLSALGMPGARVSTLKTLAAAVVQTPGFFERGPTLDETISRLKALRGIGDWTAHYIAMRACREPDAFPASDVGLLRGAADAAGVRPTPAALLERAEAWRPWRAYAAHHLWALDSAARDGVRSVDPDATLLT